MTTQEVTVIIPFYNAHKTLPLCLTALCAQSTSPCEIILVDNNSNDTSKDIVESFSKAVKHVKISYVAERAAGPAAARNAGARIARGDWLLFTDADCIPSGTWLSDYLVQFSEPGLGAVAGCIRPYPPSNMVQKAISLFTLPPVTREAVFSESTLTEGFYPTANLGVRKKVFHLVGGFNANLRYGEDHELCHKIYQAGYRIKAVETAVVEHIHRNTVKGLVKQAFGFGSSHPFELRHFTTGRTIFVSPFHDINKPTPGKWIWVDLNQADKKLLLSLIPAIFWWPLSFVSLLYFCRLCFFVYRVGEQRNIDTAFSELPVLALLLVVKSFALSAGRLVYSFKNKVLCI